MAIYLTGVAGVVEDGTKAFAFSSSPPARPGASSTGVNAEAALEPEPAAPYDVAVYKNESSRNVETGGE